MAVNIGPGEIGLFQGNDKFKVDEIASLRVVLARINQKGILGDDKVRAAVISATDRKNYADVLLKVHLFLVLLQFHHPWTMASTI